MAIGDYLTAVHDRALTRLAIRTFGVIDLHTHSRLRPLLAFFGRRANKRLDILEVGCGDGVNLFELHRRMSISAAGYDLSKDAIDQARTVNDACFESALEFHCDDVTTLKPEHKYDYVLCMDILEHLDEPGKLLAALDPIVRPDGGFVISVPTPRYREVFGDEFNTAIGHVMDGYTLPMLDAVVPAGYRRVTATYSTGWLASLGCTLFYRYALKIPWQQLRVATQIVILALFKWFDPWNGPGRSCSLFAVYERRADNVAP